jgi:hypothetical protein
MSSSTETGELKLESTVKTATGVELSNEQRTIVSSVLDLFAGRPSLAKLQLWKDDAVFSDPITVAKGRKEFEPQWVCHLALRYHEHPANTLPQYGLQTAFSEIERKDHSVTSSGNPIELDMTTMYKVKGIGKETTITSKVNIFHENGKITRVEDKWNGNLPDSGIANVSNYRGYILNPFFWADWAFSWFFAGWVLFSDWPHIMVRCFCVVFTLTSTLHLLICQYAYYPLHVSINTDTSFRRHSDDSTPLVSPRWSACPRTQRRMPSAAIRSAATL